MTSLTSDDLARGWADRLERAEARRFGLSLSKARKRVADKIGVPAGTLENLSRHRIKGVRHALYMTLRSAVLSEVQREIAALEHELHTLAEAGLGAGNRKAEAVVAGLERLRALVSAASNGEAV